MMESDETLVEFISQLGELEEGGSLAASAAEYLAKKLAELSDADLQNLKALQEAEGGAMDYGQYQRWQAAKSHQYGAQLTTMEGM